MKVTFSVAIISFTNATVTYFTRGLAARIDSSATQIIAPPSVLSEWKQPSGAHEAYNIGVRETFDGLVYESMIDPNIWS